MKVAILASYPAQYVLDECMIKSDYQNKISHPASWIRALTTALSKRDDIEFKVFTHSRAVRRTIEVNHNGVAFVVIPQHEPARFGCLHMHLPARIQFRKAIKQYAPDIVHGYGTESSYGLIASEQSIPSIVTIQGIREKLVPYMMQGSRVRKIILEKLERCALKNADVLIANTKFAMEWAQIVDEHVKVEYIPNSVNPEFFNAVPKYSSKEVMCLSTINKTKAIDVTIRALACCTDQNTRLSIVGRGPLLQDMIHLANELSVAERITFHGFLDTREEVISIMERVRAFVIPSRMDTSPNSLTEAHAVGLPVIGSKAGGIPDMIQEGKDGYLVDVDDHKELANIIDYLANNPELCRKLGSYGRKKVMALNSPEVIAERHMRLYRKMVGIL